MAYLDQMPTAKPTGVMYSEDLGHHVAQTSPAADTRTCKGRNLKLVLWRLRHDLMRAGAESSIARV